MMHMSHTLSVFLSLFLALVLVLDLSSAIETRPAFEHALDTFVKHAVPASTAAAAFTSASASNPRVRLHTSSGDIVIRLRADLAPKHSELIQKLVESHSFDDCVIYRAETGFVIQMGLRLESGGVRPK